MNPQEVVSSVRSVPDQDAIIAEGVVRRWLAGGSILAYTVTTVKRESIDAWIDDATEIVRTWALDHPLRLMHHLNGSNLAFTPYLRSRVKAFAGSAPDRQGRVALIFTESVLARLAQLFLKANGDGRVVPQIFFDEETALSWLTENLDSEPR